MLRDEFATWKSSDCADHDRISVEQFHAWRLPEPVFAGFRAVVHICSCT